MSKAAACWGIFSGCSFSGREKKGCRIVRRSAFARMINSVHSSMSFCCLEPERCSRLIMSTSVFWSSGDSLCILRALLYVKQTLMKGVQGRRGKIPQGEQFEEFMPAWLMAELCKERQGILDGAGSQQPGKKGDLLARWRVGALMRECSRRARVNDRDQGYLPEQQDTEAYQPPSVSRTARILFLPETTIKWSGSLSRSSGGYSTPNVLMLVIGVAVSGNS